MKELFRIFCWQYKPLKLQLIFDWLLRFNSLKKSHQYKNPMLRLELSAMEYAIYGCGVKMEHYTFSKFQSEFNGCVR